MQDSQQQPVIIRIQLIDGNTQIENAFAPHCTLEHVAQFVKQKAKEMNLINYNADSYNIYTKRNMLDFVDPVPPRRHFKAKDFKNSTLAQLGFKGRIRLLVALGEEALEEKAIVQEMVQSVIPNADYQLTLANKLKGDSVEEQERFKQKLRQHELDEKLLEKKKKKEELERVRRQIEEDKERRRDKFHYQ